MKSQKAGSNKSYLLTTHYIPACVFVCEYTITYVTFMFYHEWKKNTFRYNNLKKKIDRTKTLLTCLIFTIGIE